MISTSSHNSSFPHLNGNGRHHHNDGCEEEEEKGEEDAEEDDVDVDALVQRARDAFLSSLSSSSSSSSPSTSSSSSFMPLTSLAKVASSTSSSSSSPQPPHTILSTPRPALLFKKSNHLFQITPSALPLPPTSSPSPAPSHPIAASHPHPPLSHFDLPTPVMSTELRRDLRLLALRPYLDPKRFYKKSDRKVGEVPKEFAVGRVVSDASEFYGAREAKGDRREWLAEKVQEEGGQWLKRKFNEVQSSHARTPWKGKKPRHGKKRK